jgi:hypothetical protein
MGGRAGHYSHAGVLYGHAKRNHRWRGRGLGADHRFQASRRHQVYQHLKGDGFAKSPSAALRFVFPPLSRGQACSVLLCTLHPSSGLILSLSKGASYQELFTVLSALTNSYEVIEGDYAYFLGQKPSLPSRGLWQALSALMAAALP